MVERVRRRFNVSELKDVLVGRCRLGALREADCSVASPPLSLRY